MPANNLLLVFERSVGEKGLHGDGVWMKCSSKWSKAEYRWIKKSINGAL